jgi:hypothetical protein
MFPLALFLSQFFGLSSTFVTYITNLKEEVTTYLFWDCPKILFYFYEPIQDAYQKRKKIELWESS